MASIWKDVGNAATFKRGLSADKLPRIDTSQQDSGTQQRRLKHPYLLADSILKMGLRHIRFIKLSTHFGDFVMKRQIKYVLRVYNCPRMALSHFYIYATMSGLPYFKSLL